MMKRILYAFAVFSFMAALFGCQKEIVEVSLEFKETQYELEVGSTLDLSKALKVKNTSEKPQFSSSDKKVVSVDVNGLAEAHLAGEARITASVAGKTASCVITVPEVKAGSITLNAPADLVAGDENWAVLTAVVETPGFDMDDLEWTFEPSDEALDVQYEKVSSSEYKFRFGAYVEGGTLTVTVSDLNSSVSQSVSVAVVEPEPEEVAAKRISLNYPLTLTEGESAWGTVSATVTPEDYDTKNLEWQFAPSDTQLGFEYDKVDDLSYKIRFASFKEGGKVVITVTDKVSGLYSKATVSVKERPEVGVSEISVSPESMTLYTGGDPVSVQVECTPSDYDKALLQWTSSDQNVVTVESGIVTIVGPGEAVVKVKDSVSGLEAECSVTVKTAVEEGDVKSIALNPVKARLMVGSALQLVATCYDGPSGLGEVIEGYSNLEWSAEKLQSEIGMIEVVEVTQSGVVKAKAVGYTYVTVSDKTNPAIKATCYVEVIDGVKPTGIVLTPEALVLPLNSEYEGFSYVITPADCEYNDVVWDSSDKSVATVSQTGKVTTIKEGVTVISVTTKEGGYSAECQVTVKDQAFTVNLQYDESVMANGLPQGESVQIDAAYLTADGSSYTPSTEEWKSSDTSVATVDADGLVTAVLPSNTDEGFTEKEVTITLVAENLVEASVVVKVVRALPKTLEITTYPENYQMYIGESFTFGATINPLAADQTVKWQCYCTDNPSSWKYIDLYTGAFSAWSVGTYTISAFSGYEYRNSNNNLVTFKEVKDEITIEVLPVLPQSVVINAESLDMRVGNTASLVVSFTPSNTTYQSLDWSSSDESVVTVTSNGIVTAVGTGDAVITARQEENDITVTCTVHVDAPVSDYKVGDYYYSDGTISSEIVSGKNVVGVICSLNDITGHDRMLKQDHPSCVNGLVISLAEAEAVKWQGFGASVSKWAVEHGFDATAGAGSEYISMYETNHYLTSDGEKMRGYNNTSAIRAYMARDDYESLSEDYKVHLLDGWDVTAPSGTSGWYVPSVAELLEVAENASVLAEKIAAAGGAAFDSAGYWTSTENIGTGSNAVYVKIAEKQFIANRQKWNQHKVRYVFAF